MNPLEIRRGHFYFAVKCQTCQETLPLFDVPPYTVIDAVRDQLQNLLVRCPSCTREMQVHERQVYFLEGR
jgi:hypothetical protein